MRRRAVESRFDKLTLLTPVNFQGSRRRAGARVAAHVLDVEAEQTHARLDEEPAPHIVRFFLNPDDVVVAARVLVQHPQQLFGRERVELLQTEDDDGFRFLGPLLEQVVVDLATAEDDAFRAAALTPDPSPRGRGEKFGIVQHFLKAGASGELIERGDALLVA